MIHSKLGASQAFRFLNCPGSVKAQEGLPDSTSEYAAEGTKAHELAETLLNYGKVEGANADMLAHCIGYYDYVRGLSADMTWVEQRVHLKPVDEHLFGTCDYIALDGRHLHIVDFKYGQGVSVHAKGNAQLRYYALGALFFLAEQGLAVEKVTTHIYQPRSSDGEVVSTEDLELWELQQWSACVLAPAVKRCLEDNAPLYAGKWCQWCKAAGQCPAQLEMIADVTKGDFASLTFPEPGEFTPEDISKLLIFADKAKSVIKDVESFAYKAALEGNVAEGMKLVKKKKNRAWVDESAAGDALDMLVGEDAYERKLLSPSKTEALLKKGGIDKAEIEDLWHVPEGGLTLVPVTDKRPAVNDFDTDFNGE